MHITSLHWGKQVYRLKITHFANRPAKRGAFYFPPKILVDLVNKFIQCRRWITYITINRFWAVLPWQAMGPI